MHNRVLYDFLSIRGPSGLENSPRKTRFRSFASELIRILHITPFFSKLSSIVTRCLRNYSLILLYSHRCSVKPSVISCQGFSIEFFLIFFSLALYPHTIAYINLCFPRRKWRSCISPRNTFHASAVTFSR